MKKKLIPERLYRQILENIPICCVDLIIHHNQKILLIKRKNNPGKNQWSIPGGRIYKNERLNEAAIRIAYEEVELNIEIGKKLGIYETMFNEAPFSNLKTGVHTINIVFIAKPIEENFKINLDKTSSDYKWVDKIDNSFIPYIKKILTDSNILT